MTDKEQEKVTYTRPKDEGEVDKRRFAGVMGVAGTAAMIGLVTFFSIGMVGAALGVGIGGFVANFEQVAYNQTTVDAGGNENANAQIYPVLGSQPACQNAPQLEASLTGQANITGGVEFFKDLPLPADFGNNGDSFARVSIIGSAPSGDAITVSDLNLRLTALKTPELSLSDAEIKEFGPGDNGYNNTTGSNDPSESFAPSGEGTVGTNAGNNPVNTPEFGINASSFVLPKGGSAATHQVSFDQISLTDLDLAVTIIDNTSSGPAVGPTPRVVSADNRTCTALAEASNTNDFNDANDTVDENVLAY